MDRVKLKVLDVHYAHITDRDLRTVRADDAYKKEYGQLCSHFGWELLEGGGVLLWLLALTKQGNEDEIKWKLRLYGIMHDMIENSKMSLAFVKILEMGLKEKCEYILVTENSMPYDDLPIFEDHSPVDGGKVETDDSAV